VKTHCFLGRTYRILRRKSGTDLGQCHAPNTKHKAITLRPDLTEQELLTYAIHEGLHACCWYMDEEHVDNVSSDIGRFLWRLGFRKPE